MKRICQIGAIALAAAGLPAARGAAGPATQPAVPLPTNMPGRVFDALAATQPSTGQMRDPTEADPALRRALEAGQPPVAAPAPPPPPVILRRGLIIVNGKPAAALVEVDGGTLCFIHEGSVFNAGGNLVRVLRLGADGMQFELSDSKNTKILLR